MKLGIMGGTFDPIHRGHLRIARAAMRELDLDRVVFLPDGDPPHKTPAAPGEDRLAMVRAAAARDARFEVSDLELRRGGRTYTVDTLLLLREQRNGAELVYLVGSDTLLLFHTWKEPARVAELCELCAALRPGDSLRAVRQAQEFCLRAYGLRSRLLHFRGPDISSSAVRDACAEGKPIGALVPRAVEAYIRNRRLYGLPPDASPCEAP